MTISKKLWVFVLFLSSNVEIISFSVRIGLLQFVWSLSITVSTTGFHPVNAGSTPAEITRDELDGSFDPFFVRITE